MELLEKLICKVCLLNGIAWLIDLRSFLLNGIAWLIDLRSFLLNGIAWIIVIDKLLHYMVLLLRAQ